ncbi:MAG: hypothetical protein V4507_06510 [Verrucomicrobiota bacterium]
MNFNRFSQRIPFLWNNLILILPLILTWTLIQIPPVDDPRLGKAHAFLCWENSWHDFSTIFHFSKALQENPVERPYTTAGQLETYEDWLHETRQEVMPVSYFPTCFQLWGWLSFLSAPSAFFLWNLLGAIIWLKATIELHRQFSPLRGTFLSIVIAFSSAGYFAFFFGQSALLFAGLLILMSSRRCRSSEGEILFTSFSILLLISKPPGAILAWSLLIVQKRWKEFFCSLLAPIVITFIFCYHHGGVQTLVDYIDWIRSCNVVSIGDSFSKAITPLFQSNWIAFAIEKTSLSLISIHRLNQIFLFGGLGVGGGLIYFKKIDLRQAPLGGAWLYLLFSPYLVITEDLIAGWIVYQWGKRHPHRLPWAMGWLLLLLNTSQAYAVVFPEFFYLHPVSWGIKLGGFFYWLWSEMRFSKSTDFLR